MYLWTCFHDEKMIGYLYEENSFVEFMACFFSAFVRFSGFYSYFISNGYMWYVLWNLTCEWVALRWYFWWSFVLVFHWVWRLANYGDTKEGTMLTLNPNVVRISVGIWLGLIPTFFWLLSKSMYLYRSWKLLKIICHHHSLCWCTCIHVMWFHEHPPERVFSL